MKNQDNIRPLHIACLHGHEKVARLLLKNANADPNVKSRKSERTPLHLACQYNNIEVSDLIICKVKLGSFK